MGCGCGNDGEYSEKAEKYVERPQKGRRKSGSTRRTSKELNRQDSGSRAKRTNTATTTSTFSKQGTQQVPPKPLVSTENVRVDVSKFVTEGRGELHERYIEQAVLGKGAYGEVRLILDTVTKELKAMKVISKENCPGVSSAALLQEIEVLKKLDHPNIIKLYEFYQDEFNYYLITEQCTGGELFDRIIELKRFTEQKAAVIMKQVLSAVAYCHKLKVVHRDLKPENILFETPAKNSCIKVIDFGTAMAFCKDQKMKKCLGTAYYVAPEVLKKNYDEKCDVWSCGIIMYILLCGYPPFSGETDPEIYVKIQNGKFSFSRPEWKQVSYEAKMMITKMLTYRPEERITATEALNDPWIQKFTAAKSPEITKSSVLALRSLKNFNVKARLQQAVMAYIAGHLQSKESEDKLKAAFRAFDKNGDGLLEKSELIEGYMKMGLNRHKATVIVTNIMKKIDINKNGTIDYSEFLMANLNQNEVLAQEKLKEAFKIFDKDGNGQITMEEIKEVLGSDNNEALKEVIREADGDGDGQISFKEFKKMMLSIYNR